VTPLERALRERIAAEGPISVEAFMQACNDHYYATRDPLGARGDFTTAPEVSQMFGEIGIRTAANIKCYWRNPDATAVTLRPDGYVRTGDIGYLDEEGYLFIVDRKKEIIIRGGENISAAEVEAECYACPSVAEAAVFGAADERLGEVPVAVIYVKDGEQLSEDGLRAFLDGKLAKFKIPQRIIISSEPLPRLGTGKIDRRALKAQYAQS
jgi:acyl-CoA synthetase (AMP-forming)/AMP-acid ligase II